MIMAWPMHHAVTRCLPSIAHLPELVTRLNRNNDFSEFVKAIRAAFKQSCGAA